MEWVEVPDELRVTLAEMQASDEHHGWSHATRRKHQRVYESGMCNAAIQSRLDRRRWEPCGEWPQRVEDWSGGRPVEVLYRALHCGMHLIDDERTALLAAQQVLYERQKARREAGKAAREAAKARRVARLEKKAVPLAGLRSEDAEHYLLRVLLRLKEALAPAPRYDWLEAPY